MTDYSWLPYWLFGVVCIAFGLWLRGLLVNAPYDPNEPSSGAVYDAMPDPLDDYDVMRAKWLSLRFHRDTLEAQNSLRVTDEAL